MEHTALQVNLGELHSTRFRGTESMTVHEQQTTIPCLVPAAFCGLYKPGHFCLGQVLTRL